MPKLTKKAAAQLREHLAGQEHDRLVDLLMAEVERNAALKGQLLLEIAETGGPLDLAQSAARSPTRSGPRAPLGEVAAIRARRAPGPGKSTAPSSASAPCWRPARPRP